VVDTAPSTHSLEWAHTLPALFHHLHPLPDPFFLPTHFSQMEEDMTHLIRPPLPFSPFLLFRMLGAVGRELWHRKTDGEKPEGDGGRGGGEGGKEEVEGE
jgi:hypothetical protein